MVSCEVCLICMRGRKPSCIACLATEYAPVITAWDAITAAIVASTIIGYSAHGGTASKNGFFTASGCASTNAPCPR